MSNKLLNSFTSLLLTFCIYNNDIVSSFKLKRFPAQTSYHIKCNQPQQHIILKSTTTTTDTSSSITSSSSNFTSSASSIPLNVQLADTLVSSLFSIKPLFDIASAQARSSMIKQGLSIGVDWKANVESIESKMTQLQHEYDLLIKESSPSSSSAGAVDYPDYYLKPFHAYDEGNLSWKAALEVESASLTVHAHLFSPPEQKERVFRLDGDFTLRDNFHQRMLGK